MSLAISKEDTSPLTFDPLQRTRGSNGCGLRAGTCVRSLGADAVYVQLHWFCDRVSVRI